MAKGSAGLSEQEIWDDSALVRSWDDAVQEYKRYHSIATSGEDVQELLKRVKAEEDHEAHLGDGAVAADSVEEAGNASQDGTIHRNQDANVENFGSDASFSARTMDPFPQLHPSSTLDKDDAGGLKALMMSWYYAGYYTGLHEGKQQAIASRLQQADVAAHIEEKSNLNP